MTPGVESQVGTHSVFVVEDDAPVRGVLVEALERSGLLTTGFGDGMSALTRLEEELPEVILLDMRMPEMDGFEFLSRLRANPAWVSIPVIIVSGLGADLLKAIDAHSAESLGVAGIFAKPFDIPTLLRYVQGVITRSPMLRSAEPTTL